jgi:hypothetical protein
MLLRLPHSLAASENSPIPFPNRAQKEMKNDFVLFPGQPARFTAHFIGKYEQSMLNLPSRGARHPIKTQIFACCM